ncbi:oxidoreductase [Demequina sp. TTPB684]|uniref:oxidoreductase n=1 Tax=unclassified Demequina TaxID=2620311 RepID=UPI001CF59A30|nr:MULTISPECIES: oxidoreductase [unclassified Demequina]MCB2413813.1 oxidoreductase [Demequina sp. TTPB684]UPU89126.1 oxidoreductase [Demequina sp. TMPB413]
MSHLATRGAPRELDNRDYAVSMSFLGRLFGRGKSTVTPTGSGSREAQAKTMQHFKEFVSQRDGCEAFIEPATRVTQTTLVVVAGTGEWTRRKVPDAAAARKVAKDLSVPVFDVNLSGYPSRMREWNEKHRQL